MSSPFLLTLPEKSLTWREALEPGGSYNQTNQEGIKCTMPEASDRMLGESAEEWQER